MLLVFEFAQKRCDQIQKEIKLKLKRTRAELLFFLLFKCSKLFILSFFGISLRLLEKINMFRNTFILFSSLVSFTFSHCNILFGFRSKVFENQYFFGSHLSNETENNRKKSFEKHPSSFILLYFKKHERC